MSSKPTIWQNRIVGYSEEAPDQLLANPMNARIHPKHQQDALSGVLHEVGIVQNIIVNRESGYVLDGHLRVSLALRDRQPTVPVTWVDVSEQEESLILATLDPISAAAAYDREKLDDLLRDVSTSDAAVQQLLADLAEQVGIPSVQPIGNGGDDFDVDTALDGDCRVQLGDIWTLGGVHRVCCGDSTDSATVARVVDGARAVLCVTDPPYAVDYDPQWRVGLGGGGTQEFANGDKIANDQSLDWLPLWTTIPADVLYIWFEARAASVLQAHLEQLDYIYLYEIIWNKDRAIFGRGDYHWKHEKCLYLVKRGKPHNYQGDRTQSTVWDIPVIQSFAVSRNPDEWELAGHGNQKPIECMQRPIKNNSAKSDLIFDPFLGSGTTLIASHRLERRCYGIEIDPLNCEIILRRAEAEQLSVELTERI